MKARPLQDRVILKRIEEAQTVKGGIIIPDTAKEKPMEGEVVSAGPGKMMEDGKRSPITVKPGDRVLFGKYSGTEITIDDEEYVIMREEEILAVLVKEKEAAQNKKYFNQRKIKSENSWLNRLYMASSRVRLYCAV
jgi:chaperonin GroES